MVSKNFIDTILGKTLSRLKMENKICKLFGRKEYMDATKKERELIRKMFLFVSTREKSVIELTYNHLKELK